jgi:tetratricopeptide (TPR) repeat protein
MVFGFGFNKTKVLASAERNVKQGKLQNAISDYERVLAEDPKDLTVMNTVGDLYARVGNTEKATEYFKKIGDAYAGEGFTVRAIAMYKKLTKQNPGAVQAVLKLGELYTQQGLHNDARAQFLQVAEHRLRNNELQGAASVLQKTLELDPENSSLQTRLADLYVKIGRAADARDLYFRNAEALRARGALDLADDALGRVLNLDPNYGPAILARGQVKFDSGDAEGAAHLLEQVPDIDSRPEGLRTLLNAYLSLGNVQSAEPIARKMLTVYNDPSGITGYGEALMAAGSYEQAVNLFSEHSSALLTSNQPGFMQALQALTSRVKSSTKSLELLAAIFQRAGNSGLIVEVTELLAHAYVQEGNLQKARDLYQRLTALEPENPQHALNYKQIVLRQSEHLPPHKKEEKHEVEPEPEAEVEASGSASEDILPASLIEQKYPGDLSELVEAALTDAELFDSYNLASRAIAPLEIILTRVPNDVRVNQRLASLYARAGRLKDAAERFAILERVHVEAGYLKDSRHYAELAARYRERAGLPAEPKAEAQRSDSPAPRQSPAPIPQTANGPAVPSRPPHPAQPATSAAAPATHAVPAAAQSHEIDLSAEWEQMLDVEQPEPAASAAHLPQPVTAPEPEQPAASTSVWDAAEVEDPVAELLDEIRFYMAQAMWHEANSAVARCEAIAPGNPELERMRAQLAAGRDDAFSSPGTECEIVSEDIPVDAEIELPLTIDPLLISPAEQEGVSTLPPPEFMPEPQTFQQIPEELAKPTPAAEPQTNDTETILDRPVEPAPAIPVEEPVSAAPPEDAVTGFVHELEASLGDDFQLDSATQNAAPPIAESVPASASVAVPPDIAPPAVPALASPVAPAQQIEAAPASQPPVSAEPTITPEEERDALSDIFAEFKESMESGSETQEDPETHYNLGVAFKEMDLFDEAIGEFQKVCQSIERGQSFTQSVQAYTWLADCFLKKGVPDLAIRWYERALKAPAIDYETDTAIRYELACACVEAGDRQTALSHFMEVYGTNIDYRDVAERIKSLRS